MIAHVDALDLCGSDATYDDVVVLWMKDISFHDDQVKPLSGTVFTLQRFHDTFQCVRVGFVAELPHQIDSS